MPILTQSGGEAPQVDYWHPEQDADGDERGLRGQTEPANLVGEQGQGEEAGERSGQTLRADEEESRAEED